MEKVNIFWDPEGVTLDQTSKKTYAGPPADGDTPYRGTWYFSNVDLMILY